MKPHCLTALALITAGACAIEIRRDGVVPRAERKAACERLDRQLK